MKASGPKRLALRAAMVVVLAALATFAWVKVQPTDARESLCKQGATLNEARLLQEALTALVQAEGEDDGCEEAERKAVEGKLERAERNFGVARALESIEPASVSKDKDTAKKEKAAATRRNANLAIDRYITGLNLNPFDELARPALGAQLQALPAAAVPKQAEFRCQLTVRLTAAGLLDAAGTAVAKGLEKAPKQCGKALSNLNGKRAAAAGLAREAQRLGDRGGDAAKVRDTYAAALLANAQLLEARAGLEGAIDDESVAAAAGSWLSGLAGTLKDSLEWVIPAIVLLLVAVLLLGSLGRVITRSPHVSQRLAAWSVRNPQSRFLRQVAVPQVTVTDFEGGSDDGAQGADFSALLAEMLPSKAGREPAFPFDRVTKGSENDQKAADFSDVLGGVPQAQALGGALKLLGRITRRRKISVGGRLTPLTAPGGAGVTVALEGAGQSPESNITLWERGYDPLLCESEDAVRWFRLIAPATVWARWQIAARILPDLDPTQWRADALFQAGVAWQAQDDPRRAEALYVEALELDPKLLPAAHNLALIEVRSGRYREARERLEWLQGRLKKDPGIGGQWPLLETGYLYTLVLAHAYDSTSTGSNQNANFVKARDVAQQLVGLVARKLGRKRTVTGLGADDLAELERVEAPSVVVLASLTASSDPELRKEAVDRLVKETATGKIERKDLAQRVAKLKPWELVDGYVRTQPSLTRRTHYNLACYYLALSEGAGKHRDLCLDRAMARLRKALEGRGHETWVHEDPSLERLRKDARWKELKKFLADHAVTPHEGEDEDDENKDKTPSTDGGPTDVGLAGPLERAELSLRWIRRQLDR